MSMKEQSDAGYIGRHIEDQEDKIKRLESKNEILRDGLIKLRDCDFVITLPDRMDAVRKIAREHLGEEAKI